VWSWIIYHFTNFISLFFRKYTKKFNFSLASHQAVHILEKQKYKYLRKKYNEISKTVYNSTSHWSIVICYNVSLSLGHNYWSILVHITNENSRNVKIKIMEILILHGFNPVRIIDHNILWDIIRLGWKNLH